MEPIIAEPEIRSLKSRLENKTTTWEKVELINNFLNRCTRISMLSQMPEDKQKSQNVIYLIRTEGETFTASWYKNGQFINCQLAKEKTAKIDMYFKEREHIKRKEQDFNEVTSLIGYTDPGNDNSFSLFKSRQPSELLRNQFRNVLGEDFEDRLFLTSCPGINIEEQEKREKEKIDEIRIRLSKLSNQEKINLLKGLAFIGMKKSNLHEDGPANGSSVVLKTS